VHQIYLVPGFLGFKELGDLGYFQGVHGILRKELREKHGIEASVIAVDTLATASLPRRARHLLEEVRARRAGGVEGIHFVGHSTGGLDVRLLLSERAVLEGESTDPDILERTRTAEIPAHYYLKRARSARTSSAAPTSTATGSPLDRGSHFQYASSRNLRRSAPWATWTGRRPS